MRKPENGRTRYIALETGLLQAAIVRKYIERSTIPKPDADQPDQNYQERLAEREDLLIHCKNFQKMHDNDKLMWYGYLHKDGTIHVNRYLSEDDFRVTGGSTLVDIITEPFEADDRTEALKIVAQVFPA